MKEDTFLASNESTDSHGRLKYAMPNRKVLLFSLREALQNTLPSIDTNAPSTSVLYPKGSSLSQRILKRQSMQIRIALIGFVLLLGAHHLMAQTTSWNTGSGNWTVDGNWTNLAPNNGGSEDIIIDCSCTVTWNGGGDLTLNGSLYIESGSTLDMNNQGLLIGSAGNNGATLTNNGTISNINHFENGGDAVGLGNGPWVTNSGTMSCFDMRIGNNLGGGYFINKSTGVVNVTDQIHMDATLCNSGTMILGGRFWNHGGLVDCCGTIETPSVEAAENPEIRPGTFLCIDMCTTGGADPTYMVGGGAEPSLWVDDPTQISTDEDDTYICGTNENGVSGPPVLPGPGGVTPNLTLWLKGNDGTNTITDGDGLMVWSDQSRNGNFVQQLTAANQPIFRDNSTDNINYNPVVDFDGTDDVMNDLSGLLLGSITNHLNVYVVSVSDVVQDSYIFSEACSPSEFSLSAPASGGNYNWNAGNTTGDYQLTTAWGGTTSQPYLWSNLYSTVLGQTVSGTRQVVQRNGLTIASDATASTVTGSASQFDLGSDLTSYFNGKIAEIVVYVGPIDGTQHSQIESYLAIKYGMTLDNSGGGTDGDYVASDGTTVLWDADANATYHNDVAGIGRDDDAALDQQRSLSSNSGAMVIMDKEATMPADKDYMLWGNNNGSTTPTGTGSHPDYDFILPRIWKADVTGSPGTVQIRMIYPNNGVVDNYALHVDSNTDFTAGTSDYIASSISGDTLTFDAVTIADGNFFTLGITSRGPGNIKANLELWLKAGANVTGSPTVTAWGDQSLNGYHATAGGAPQLNGNGLNYNPTISFDGASDFFGGTVDVQTNTVTAFAIVKMPTYATTLDDYEGVFSIFSTGLNDHDNAQSVSLMTRFWTSDWMSTFGNGSNHASTNPKNIADDAFHIVSGQMDGSQNQLFVEGQGYTSAAHTFSLSSEQYLIASRSEAVPSLMEGEIAELVFYEQTLSASDRQKIESYLAIKYGITLSTDNDGNTTALQAPNGDGIHEGDYIASDATVLWDASANTTYHYDVTGVGRDDNSVLDQRKSISSNGDDIVIMDKGGAFSTDLDFILWGNDDGPTTLSSTGASPDYNSILGRTWTAAVNGTPGNVTVSIVYPNSGVLSAHGLLVDSDNDFTSGATNIPVSSINGDTLIFDNVSLSDGQFFTLGVNILAPGFVTTDLGLWLKADLGTNTTTEGGAITSWEDQSVGGYDATGTGDATYASSFSNFNPAIDFTNDGQPIQGSISRTNGTASTMFVIGEKSAVSGEALVEIGTGTNRAYFYDDRYAGAASYSVQTGAASLWVVSDPGGASNATIYQDGLSIDTQVKTGNTNWTAGGAYYLGDDRDGNNELTGSIAEVIYYDQQLSATDRQKVETYLALKYGITLDNSGGGTAGDYVTSEDVTIWDASANTLYHYDVTGIGRDDNSDLDQQRSLSANSDGKVIIDHGSAFGADGDFIMWGNDNDPAASTGTGASAFYNSIFDRTWKVAITGTPGNVTVRVIQGNDGITANYGLLVDADGNFAAGATNYAAASISGDTITFNNVALTDGIFFTLGLNATGPGFVTGNLELWLKGNAGTNTTTNGGAVTSWEDQSASGNDATGTGDATYLSSFANYNPGVNFTDDVQPVSGSITRPNGTASTIFVVGNTQDTRDPIFQIGTAANDVYFYGEKYAGGADGLDLVISTNQTAIWAISDPGGLTDAVIYEDGASIFTQTKTEDTDWTTGANYYVGDDRQGGGKGDDKFLGQIAEVAFYDQQLSAADQQKVETYLAIKYGITLDDGAGGTAGDYVLWNGTTLWDASANSTYHNDVAAIGRNDYSGLDQQKSLSANADGMVIMDKGGAFGSDLDFIVWGNNDGSLTPSGTGASPFYTAILGRKWQVAVSGTPGPVTVQIISNNSGTVSNYGLLIDADGDFTAGATNVPAVSISGDTITFNNVTFADGDFFSLGGDLSAPGFVGDDLILWLRADAGTNTTTDGGAITSWEDQGALAHNATGTGDAVYQSEFANFNPAISFTNDDFPMQGSVTRTNGTASTIFVVGEIPTVNDKALVEIGTGANQAYFFDERYAGATSYVLQTNVTSIWAVSDPGGLTSATIYENGLSIDTQTKSENTNWTTGGTYYIGDDRSGNDKLTGEIAEVIYYDQQLSAADQQKVETYLALKYGITLDDTGGGTAGDYVLSNGTTLWDADVNNVYHNDVAGIGRHDYSSFDQQKSLSANANALVIMDKGEAFGTDFDFVLWGNNGGSIIPTTSGASPDYNSIIGRTWLAEVNGTPGTVTVRMIYGNDGLISNHGLLVDTNTDFSSGATNYPAASISGDTITFDNVTIQDGNFFTLGINATAPGYVTSELTLWLKANAGTNTTTEAGAITSWDDQSADGHDATGTGDATYLSSFANFNPAINFTNDDWPMQGSIARTNGTGSTIFVVGEIPTTNDKALMEIGTGANQAFFFDEKYAGATSYALQINQPSIWAVSDPGALSNASIYEDGLLINTQVKTENTNWTTGGTYYIGDDRNGNDKLTGVIAEVVYYDQQLSSVDQQKVESYLAIKYGITLSNSGGGTAGDLVASDGTLLWDASDVGSYHNDVAAIGRNDYSGLGQQQSISINSDAIVIMDKGGAFGNDISFVAWGNNDGSLTLTETGASPEYTSILPRIWTTSVAGTPGNVTVKMIFENDGLPSNHGLLVDTDENFTTGATRYSASSISGDTIIFENVSFSDANYFTMGVNATAPGNVSADLTLWLKANIGTNTTTNGVGITAWGDQSGLDHDATGTGDATYLTSFSNYNPGISFTNDDFPLQGSIARTNGTASTIIVVGEIPTTNDKALIEIGTGANQAFFFDEKYAGATSYALTTTQPAIWVASDPGGLTNATIYENGQNIDTQVKTENTNWTTGGTYYIGDDRNGNDKLTGEIAEVIYYDGQLSATDQQKVESYLAIKYGITLSNVGGGTAGDVVASDGTVLWDADANGTYHNDVAAIGRNDYSGLEQRKSISASSDAMVIMDKGAAFDTDIDFIVWGNNNGSTTFAASGQHPDYDQILPRTWQAGVNGTPGQVSVQIIISNTGIVSNYALHVDGDGTFSDGNATNFPATNISGDTITFANATFTDGDFFTVGISQRAPGDVSNQLVLWLQGSAEGNSEGDAVASMLDQSGTGNSVSQAVGASQPTFRNNTTDNINYNPVIEFDGTDDFISTTGTDLLINPDGHYTKFGVVVTHNLGTNQTILAGSNALPHILRINDVSKVAVMHNNAQVRVNNTIINANTPVIGVARYSPTGTHAVRVSGSIASGGTDNTLSDGALDIGGFRNGNATAEQFLDGSLGEVIAYNTDLSNYEIEKIESYLAMKYGITLTNTGGGTAGDYKASDGTILWDADEDPDYHNDIIVIGRDDDSGLYQRQSHSPDDSIRVFIDNLASDNLANSGAITNDLSFIAIGHNDLRLIGGGDGVPRGIISRFNRVWKITNTNFNDDFNLSIEWDSTGNFDINDIRLLVDSDGDFSDATILGPANGVTFSIGSIVVEGISTAHIPANSSAYVTIGSTTFSTSLPIELVNFEAEVDQDHREVVLSWATAAETNNDFFTVEKSATGQQWSNVLLVVGAGNSDELIEYEAVDTNPLPGLSYYRLKQTDFDGSSTYSETIGVSLTTDQSGPIEIYPNPASDRLVIRGAANLGALQVVNNLGQDMTHQIAILPTTNPSTVELDVSRLERGMYLLRVLDAEWVRFIKH